MSSILIDPEYPSPIVLLHEEKPHSIFAKWALWLVCVVIVVMLFIYLTTKFANNENLTSKNNVKKTLTDGMFAKRMVVQDIY